MLAAICVGAAFVLENAWSKQSRSLELRDSSLYGFSESEILGLMLIIVLINFPLWILDLTLVGFHCYLVFEGITTYEHLRPDSKINRKERQSELRRAKAEQKRADAEKNTIAQNAYLKIEAAPLGYQPLTQIPNPSVGAAAAASVEESDEDTGSDSESEKAGSHVSAIGSIFHSFEATEEDSSLQKEISTFIIGSMIMPEQPSTSSRPTSWASAAKLGSPLATVTEQNLMANFLTHPYGWCCAPPQSALSDI